MVMGRAAALRQEALQAKSGSVNFDTSTGSTSGLIAVDARSGDNGNKARDRKMHKEILESDKFPEITLAPQHVRGQIAGGQFAGDNVRADDAARTTSPDVDHRACHSPFEISQRRSRLRCALRNGD